MKKDKNLPVIECDFEENLPLQAGELTLIRDILPELIKEMLWLQSEKD